MVRTDMVWQEAQLSQLYLEGVRGAIPLAQQQIEVMLHLVRFACPTVTTFLDLGCGDGILGHALLDQYPAARGFFVDFSEPMLQAARLRLHHYPKATFLQLDYGQTKWMQEIEKCGSFDVIVSGFSVHHQPDRRKKSLYAELYQLLKPGGIFLNLEHVASRTLWGECVFNSHFVDALYTFHQNNGSLQTREQIERDFYARPDKAANMLTLVETQCEWLREIGFNHVDCYLKIFELALFGGTRPHQS
jgi:tRNA (cmo5U34)-methyltransferase